MPATAHAVYLPEDLAIADSGSNSNSAALNDTVVERVLHSVPVVGIGRNVQAKIAQQRGDLEQAFALVASNYRARGYEPSQSHNLRFTPFHALPDTAVFVAKQDRQVVATLSLVVDNSLIGLPMECIYADEIARLRAEGRRLVEVTSLADCDLSLREFLPVFITLMQLLTQYSIQKGANTLVISINPRHRTFYKKVMGFVPFGAWRAYPAVQNHPAEGYFLDVALLKSNAPAMYEKVVGQALPPHVLTAYPMPHHLIDSFASRSSLTNSKEVLEMLQQIKTSSCIRRWR
ncbi:MAG: N-acyl amino acid synthase FeeM domain-containing protein [Gemmataceae bacterium]